MNVVLQILISVCLLHHIAPLTTTSILAHRRSSSSSTTIHAATNSNSNTPPPPPQSSRRLVDVICVVTGASRGIGKGIAIALGKEGATVYITGTSSSSSSNSNSNSNSNSSDPTITKKYSTNEDVGGPGTIEETADAVTAAGGVGIPMLCNHADDGQVQALFQYIDEQHGKLDLLVNNVFRVPPGGTESLLGTKFYNLPLTTWDTLMDIGLRSHYVASVYAMPLLLKAKASHRPPKPIPRPFIAMISSFGGLTYTFNVPYGVGKAAVDRLVKDMAIELVEEDIAVTSFWPGVVRTERTELLVQSGQWDSNVGIPLDHAESPEFTGRAIIAVLTDPNNHKKSGTTQVVAELAQEYHFTDIDGTTTPPSIRSLRFLLPTYAMGGDDDDARTRFNKIPPFLIPDWKLPFWILAQGKPPPTPSPKKQKDMPPS